MTRFNLNTLLFALLFSLLASSSALAQPATKPADSAGLPKVVLVGDSIRMSYADTVAKQLEGKALVVSAKANGGDSNNVVRNLTQWVIREQPAVVHINCGIHDSKRFKFTGRFQVSLKEYEANLRTMVERIRQETKAVVLFATTTPILDERAATTRAERDYELLNASVQQFNEVARRVMTELNVPVNDLHATLAKPMPPLTTEQLIVADGVHLTAAGQQLLGQQVAEFVSEHLPK